MNITVIRGTLSSEPVVRSLPSGDRLVSYEVTIPGRERGRAESVPVVWFDPPARLPALTVGDGVVLTGRVRRRFYRANSGSTASRTEVVASTVVAARARVRAQRLLERCALAISEAATVPG